MAGKGLDRFVGKENIGRYRRLLASLTDDKQRRVVASLLCEEIARIGEGVDARLPQAPGRGGRAPSR